jgi:hypothetical protein
MTSSLPLLNEYGFLPVPPRVHTVRLEDMPGCFGAKPWRMEIWRNCVQYLEWLKANTPVREVFVDGRFLSASDEFTEVEVGIEFTPNLIRKPSDLLVFNMPARDEFGVRVRFYGPHRPEKYNFHEEFNTPDPEIRLRGAPTDLRKGYIRIKL